MVQIGLRAHTQHMRFSPSRTELGASMVEYALIVVLVAVIAVGAIGVMGGETANTFDSVSVGLGGESGDPSTTTAPTTTSTTAATTTTAAVTTTVTTAAPVTTITTAAPVTTTTKAPNLCTGPPKDRPPGCK